MGEIYLITAGIQIAIFVALFAISLLVKKDIAAAKLFMVVSGLLVIISIFDFIHVFSNIYPTIAPWLSSSKELTQITHPIYVLIGIIFLFSVRNLSKK